MAFWPKIAGTLSATFGVGPKAARATLDAAGLTAARTLTLPDRTDTLAGLQDVTTRLAVSQASHGFAVGDVLYVSGSNTFAKARADSTSTAEAVGVVSAVPSSGTFVLTTHGSVGGLSGLTAGTVYFLSAGTAGAVTATEPTGANVSKPVLVALTPTTAFVVNYRGLSGGGGGSLTSSAAYMAGSCDVTGSEGSWQAVTDGTTTVELTLAAGDWFLLLSGGGTVVATSGYLYGRLRNTTDLTDAIGLTPLESAQAVTGTYTLSRKLTLSGTKTLQHQVQTNYGSGYSQRRVDVVTFFALKVG